MSKCRGSRLAGRRCGCGLGSRVNKSPNLHLMINKIKENLIMFQRRFAILFFWSIGLNEEV